MSRCGDSATRTVSRRGYGCWAIAARLGDIMSDKRKAVWCLDATAIAEFDSIDEAYREWENLGDEVPISIGDNQFCVQKAHICVMDEEEFNTL